MKCLALIMICLQLMVQLYVRFILLADFSFCPKILGVGGNLYKLLAPMVSMISSVDCNS